MKDDAFVEHFHDFPAATESSHRKATTDRFCQTDQIGFQSEVFARPATRKFHSRFHFIENEKRAIVLAHLMQSLQVAFFRHGNPDVHRDRLGDHRSDLSFIFAKTVLERFQIVESARHCIHGGSIRNALGGLHYVRRFRITRKLHGWFVADQDRIVHSVIASLHLDDLVTTGIAPSNANRMHGKFRPGICISHTVHRKTRTKLLRHFLLELVRHAVHRSLFELLSDRLQYRWICVTGHQNSETEVVIEVLVVVKIPKARPSGMLDKDGMWGIETKIACYSEWYVFFSIFERCF